MDIVVLVSGGLDSAVLCKFLYKQGEKIFPLFIDYGQLSVVKEWNASKAVLKTINLPTPTKVDLNGFGKLIPSGITDKSKDIVKEAFLPGRNMLFLSVAASYALSKNIKLIALGLLSEKFHLFPDQTEAFIVNTNIALNSAFGTDITIVTPLFNFDKKDVIKLAIDYDIPIKLTYSCHSGKDKYCGKCISCKEILDTGEAGNFQQFKQ